MDNIFKAIIAAGVVNLLMGNVILALSIGWMYYIYYETKKSD